MKIVSIGEITIDYYLNQNTSLVGGISLNFAVHAKRCGADTVSLVSRIGPDDGGRRVLEKLDQEGVDASHVAVLSGETATCDILINADGERTFPAGGYHLNVLGDHPLAIASGITPENVADYLPFADCFLVATGISTRIEELDAHRTRALIQAVRAAG